MRGSPTLGLDASAFAAAHAVQTEVVTKLYLYYDVAWWRELGLTSGDFKLDGDAANMPLKGRYHDGDVVCDDEDDPATCRGFLLAVYDHDYSGEAAMFFRRYQRERPEPVTILSGATPEGAAFLDHAHERLLECHVYMEDPPYTAYEASTVIGGAAPPTFGVLATWNAATLGAGGGWHGWTDLGLSDAMPAALAAHGAFVVNEAYSLVQGWAEGSLQAADAVLADHFGLARPWDFAASEYPVHVAQTAKAACEAATATVPNGTSGGDTGAYDDDALCFLGNASLLLADGRRVPSRRRGSATAWRRGSAAAPKNHARAEARRRRGVRGARRRERSRRHGHAPDLPGRRLGAARPRRRPRRRRGVRAVQPRDRRRPARRVEPLLRRRRGRRLGPRRRRRAQRALPAPGELKTAGAASA